jgi:hypothetical protein
MADLSNRIYADRERKTAYHEAGHAVAIASRGMQFEYVVVDPGGGGHVYVDFFRSLKKRSYGKTFSSNWKENRELYHQRDKSFLDSLAAIYLAGLIAQEIKFGTCNFPGGRGDLSAFHSLAQHTLGRSFSGSRLLEMRKRAWNSCRNELSKQETWDWVERTALALYEKKRLTRYQVLNLRFPAKSRTNSKLKKSDVFVEEGKTVIYVDFVNKSAVSYDDLVC